MNVDILIRSYHKDYPWLAYCLESIARNLHGFRDVVIVVPYGQEAAAHHLLQESGVKAKYPDSLVRGWPETPNLPGYFDQQLTKLNADAFCSADFIANVDSDTIFTRSLHASDLLADGRPLYPYLSFEALAASGHPSPWKVPTDKILKQDVPHEFMRRPMLVYPRSIYSAFRQFVQETHGKNILDYVCQEAYAKANFSEFNALGAYGWFHRHDAFTWGDCQNEEVLHYIRLLGLKQYWSWGGLTPDIKSEMRNLLDNPQPIEETK